MEKVNYRIGLDLGIASVGWAAILTDSRGEPQHIIDLGVRVFDKAEVPKTGASLAATRRMARSTRRVIRRRRHRLDRIKFLLQSEGLIQLDAFMSRYNMPGLPDVYKLRYEALDRILTPNEFAQVLVHLAKHRGFKSNRKSETKSKENGKVLAALNKNKEVFEAKNYRTIGEMIYCDKSFYTEDPSANEGVIFTPRNKAGNYQHMILRSMIEDEVHIIFERQRQLGNKYATKDFEETYTGILTSQRSFDLGPGKQANGKPSPYAISGFGDRVGICEFEKDEKRAPKSTFTAELFVALQRINNLRISCDDGSYRYLNDEERKRLLRELLSRKEITYQQLRSMLSMSEQQRFNLLNYSAKDDTAASVQKTEMAAFIKMTYFYAFSKVFGNKFEEIPSVEIQDIYDSVATILTEYKNDDSRTERLEKLGINSEQIDELLSMNPSKYQHLSIKAMRKIIPSLLEGYTYDKACERAGYDFRGDSVSKKLHILKGQVITDAINDITNPVVKRSVSQAVKVLNAIILRYGSPMAVNIELSREMAKTYKDREQIKKDNDSRFAENEKIKADLHSNGLISPTGQDIVKYRLWQEQNHICPYSGKMIPYEDLFKPGFEIDHIIPYSITFDDSYRNKVLVYAEENQRKGNRTPYEYISSDEIEWQKFVARLSICTRDFKKRQKLLKHHVSPAEKAEFKQRNLNDTKYITRMFYNLIRENLELAPMEGKKKQVWAVNGAVTAYLRKRWGFSVKDRSTDKHHALDAVVIACCTDGMIRKISNYSQGRELRYARGFQFVDEETGEVFDRDNFTRGQWDDMFGIRIPKPWQVFTEELEVRMSDNPREALKKDKVLSRKIDYPNWIYNGEQEGGQDILRPIFVSRMPNHKVSGAANEATIRSPRHMEERIILTKVPLTQLKLDKKTGEIVGYCDDYKKSDRLLYDALKKRLVEFDGNAKEAFKTEFRKPKSDGTPGPVVKKVKIAEITDAGISVNDGCGFAKNDKMVRIDIYNKDGKYYVIPIYVADTVKPELPNKAVKAHAPEKDWRDMEEKDFVFSLYPNDLVYIESVKGIPLRLNNNEVNGQDIKTVNSLLAYYIGTNRDSATIKGETHDGAYVIKKLGIQNLKKLEKRQVDLLGYVTIVSKEQRMKFR